MTSPESKVTEKYNAKWHTENPIDIEIGCIIKGGEWKNKKGEICGNGLFYHHKKLQQYLWPEKKWHRWNELLLSRFVNNRITAILGPASSGKTYESACYALCKYLCFPHETSVLVTSTDIRSMGMRIWGEIKKSWEKAKARYPKAAGYPIDSRQTIITDPKDAMIRDSRNSIICIPCLVGGQYQGLSRFVGIKNRFVLLLADELQFMPKSFCDSISNLDKNEGFQCIGMGNPKDRSDALGVLSEPAAGWDSLDETEVTKEWDIRYSKKGTCIQLVGTDSPNMDVPETDPVPFPFLINRESIQADIERYTRDSLQFSMMNLGMMPKDTQARRIITRTLCLNFHASEEAVWNGGKITKIFGIDAAYGNIGGDRCVGTELWLGNDVSGKQLVFVHGGPVIIPVSSKNPDTPEDQIAQWTMDYCTAKGIQPQHVFFDSTGRGSLGTSFARKWSNAINPVEFGGKPTNRPVSSTIKVLCKDYYSKFVSELWYSLRLTIESDQLRGMKEDYIAEAIMREWTIVKSNKIEVEPKEVMKKRMGRSPDLVDSLCTALEGARRLGFVINKITSAKTQSDNQKWIAEMIRKRNDLNRKNNLLLTK